MMAQGFEATMNGVINHNALLLNFTEEEATKVTGILACGSVKFTSPNGNVRILASDQYGYESLVYESFPSMADEYGVDKFDLMGLETGKAKGLNPDKIYVCITGAELSNLKIIVSGLNHTRLLPIVDLKVGTKILPITTFPTIDMSLMRQSLINRLNTNLSSSGALWRAGDTPFSRLSYEDKKEMYDGTVPNFNGAEYYVGGIFEIDKVDDSFTQGNSSPFVPNFDWRNRHNATVKGSPYFQNEITGWITPVKDQHSCGSCWAFSATGAVEAVAKLYRNTTYNFDLSEQELVSCSNAGTCNGGWASLALDYISNNGLQNENSFPYKAQDRPCTEKTKPLYTIKNAGKKLFSSSSNEYASIDTLKSMLLKSPLAGRIGSWSHAMTLVGYKTIKAGDVVYEKASSRITVQPGDPRIGKTAWIFKNSWGENWGDHGFLYAFVNINNIVSSAAPTLPFDYRFYPSNDPSAATPELEKALLTPACALDNDNDGYYWWGIGPRPSNLPANAKMEEDFDDSDASIGPMDQYGYPTLLKDYDLYMKDNDEDLGFEPNTTIANGEFWNAPEVWVRNNKDGILEHQNPIGGKDNYIYVRVWNRGQKMCKETRVTAFWAKAGTNLQWPDAWTGIMTVENIPVGGHIENLGIVDPLAPGQSEIVTIKWHTPNPEDYSIITNEAVGGKNYGISAFC